MKEYKLENVVFQIKNNVATIIVEKLEEYPVECTIESAREIYKALKDNKISNRTVFVRQSIINRMVREMEVPKPVYDWVTVDATVEKHVAGGGTVWIAYTNDNAIFERHATNNHESGFSVESAMKNLNKRLEPWKIKAEIKGEVKAVFARSVGI